ncbi:UvrB/UvrC motif-containing protein [Patescibacteria group bacterium]|nr:UvrB/UvrC motif-containing protein [Patescibacteria group bacterium]
MNLPSALPTEPGVYFFRDKEKKTLYIGKAKNLKHRLHSYFHKNLSLGPKTKKMLSEANNVRWLKTDTELEALLLEADLIKRLKPPYNVMWKDDKSFKYIVIESKNFPRVYTSRNITQKSAAHFGPYPEGRTVNQVLRILRKIFPFRDCAKFKFKHHQKLGRGCLYYDLKLCPAPCIGLVTPKNYNLSIKQLKLFLKSKKKKIIRDLEKQMKQASDKKDYEKAVFLRDQIEKLAYVTQQFTSPDDYLRSPNLPVDLHTREITQLAQLFDFKVESSKEFRLEAYDISHLQGQQATGSMVVLIGGVPQKSDYRRFKIRLKNQPDDTGMIKEVLRRRFDRKFSNHKSQIPNKSGHSAQNEKHDKSFQSQPDLVLIDGGKPQLSATLKVLSELSFNIPVVALAKREELIYSKTNEEVKEIKLTQHTPALQLLRRARDEAHRFALTYHKKLRKSVIS